MVNTTVLQGPLAALREAEVDLITDIAASLAEMGDVSADDRKRLNEVSQDLRDMFFLVVIIGEFNAGKSTFVNALLGEELLPTGITPTTEVIELVRYNETPERKPTMRGDSLREWSHPNTGAEGVAIVDTPGTGSVFKQHESVAKDFLHRSDLVIFLLSAKRAFAETERIYMETAKNYGKKLILVVNQIDLLEPSEQAQVRRFIEQQVREHLNLQPLLFMVSAKEAVSGEKDGGMDAVRAHLRGVFAETPPAKQKLLAQLDMAESVVKNYLTTVTRNTELVSTDTAKVKEVQQELQSQSLGLDTQLKEARADVDKVFEGMRQRGLNFIDSNLSLRKVASNLNGEKLQAEFQDVVIGRSLRDINDAAGGYVNAVVDHSRLYWRGVIDRLNQLQDLLEQEFSGGLDADIYAEQRESLQDAIRIAEAELKTYSTGRVVREIQDLFESNASGFRVWSLATVGGLIAVIAAIGAPGPLLGVGAAALAFPAFVVAAPIAAYGSYRLVKHYRAITSDTKKEFNQRVDRLMQTYHTALDDLTKKERDRLSQYGNQVLTPIFSRLEVLAKRYAEQKAKMEHYTKRIETLRDGIKGV